MRQDWGPDMFCVQPRHKTAMQKTSHDLQLSLTAFQRAQRASVERQRTVVEGVKIAVDDDAHLQYVPIIIRLLSHGLTLQKD